MKELKEKNPYCKNLRSMYGELILGKGSKRTPINVKLKGVKKDGTLYNLDVSIDEERIILSKRRLTQVDLSPLIECKNLLELRMNNNYFSHLFLWPLSHCKTLVKLDLSNNRLLSVDLRPLAECTQLKEIFLDNNRFFRVDLTPLTQCESLQHIYFDSFVELNISEDYREHFLPPALETIKEEIIWIEPLVISPHQVKLFSAGKKPPGIEKVSKILPSLKSKTKINEDFFTLEGRHKDGHSFKKKIAINEKVINLFNENLSQVDLTSLLNCKQLHTLNLHKNQLTQVDLSPLRNCRRLKVLYLSNNQLSHVDLSPLTHCTQLQELYLIRNQFEQVDLSPLNKCLKLRFLGLDKSVELVASIDFQTQPLPPALEEIKEKISWIEYPQEEQTKSIINEKETLEDEIEKKIFVKGEKRDGSPFTREVLPEVTTLSLTYQNLKLVDLTSLAQCTQLQRLNLSNNQLSQLDLTPLAQCTQLERLSLGNNRLSQLDLTPLAQCTQLQRLSLGNNQLTEVELSSISKCTQLQRLNLGNNQLKQVNLTPLTQCTKLQRLSLDKHVKKITQKDLQIQTLPPALERIREKIIWIDYVPTVPILPAPLSIPTKEQQSEIHAKQLRIPRVIEPKRLKNVTLNGINIDGKRLSKEIQNNEVVFSWNYQELVQVELTPLVQCTQLQRLNLSNNQLSQLNLMPLAKCTQLQGLSLGNNKLIEVNLYPLTKCSKLQRLSISSNELLQLDLTPLAQCTQLQRFSLNKNQLKQVDLTPLAQCAKLRKIKLDKSVKMIVSADLQTQTLPPAFRKIRKKLIWIKRKPIPSTVVVPITLEGVNTDGSLFTKEVLPEEEILSVTYKKLKLVDLTPLSSCSQILTLWLYRNQLEEVDLKPLAQCTQLQKISLSNNQLTRVDLTPLSQCPQLQRFYVHYNQLLKVDLGPLSQCSQLQQLNLSHNQLIEVDLTPLSKLKRLQQLDLSHNQIINLDLTPLSQCPQLQRLILSHNQLQEVNLTPLTHSKQLRILLIDDSVKLSVLNNLQIESLPPAFEYICKNLPWAITEKFYQEKPKLTSTQIRQKLLEIYLEKGGRYPFRKHKSTIAKLLNIETSVLTEMHEKLYDEGFLSFIDSSPREWILTEKGRNFLQDHVGKLTSPENEKSIIDVENKTFLNIKKFYVSRSSFYYFNENLLREEFANMRFSQSENSEFYREFYTEILDVLTTVAEDRMIIKIEEKIPQLIKTIVKKPDDIWKIDDYDVMIKVVSLLPNSSYSLNLDPEVIDSYISKQNDLYLLIFLSTIKLFILIPPIDIRRTFNNEVISKVDKRFSPTGKLYLLSLYPKLNRLDLKVGEKSLVVNKFINSSDIPVLRKLTSISAHNAMQILFLAGNLNRLSQMRSFSRET